MDFSEFWIFITLGWIAWFGSLLLIAAFFRDKKVREQPGDIILGLSLSDFGLTTHWIVSAIWSGHWAEDLSHNATFCTINAFISLGSVSLEYCYSISLYFFLVKRMGNTLRNSHIPQHRYHIASLAVCISFLLYTYLNDMMGLNVYGTCSIKKMSHFDAQTIVGVVVLVALVVANCVYGVYTYCYIKKNSPKSALINKKTTEFLNYYNIYVSASLIFWLLASLAEGAGYLIDEEAFLNAAILSPLGNLCKLLLPLILTVIRYNDPMVKTQMRMILCFWRRRYRNSPLLASEKDVSDRTDINIKTDLEEPLRPSRRYVGEPVNKSFTLIEDLYESLKSSSSEFERETGVKAITIFLEIQTRYTVLAGARYCFKEYTELTKTDQDITYSNKFSTKVNAKVIEKKFPDYNFGKYPPLSGTFTFYQPELFKKIHASNKKPLELCDSLHLNKNLEAIRYATGGDGGKSGEFFFFSKDNKLLIKTIGSEEQKELLRVLESLHEHFKVNPDSRIAKVFGLFTFERENAGSKIHFVIMENVCNVPEKYILRRYDLKGSTYDRDALKGTEVSKDHVVQKKTLKDMNFIKIEKELRVDMASRLQLADAIEKDANYFKSQNLIDYSLLVFVVDKNQLLADAEKDVSLLQWAEALIDECPNHQGLGYQLGIIDYLQVYNFQKKVELHFKRLKTATLNLDASSQPPNIYAKRFISFVRKILGLESELATTDNLELYKHRSTPPFMRKLST